MATDSPESTPRKAPRAAGASRPRDAERVETLAAELYARMVTNPAYQNVDRRHLADSALCKARDFYDVADDHLR